MRALEILLERRWILKSREKELYYQIKDELGTVKKFLMEKLGYQDGDKYTQNDGVVYINGFDSPSALNTFIEDLHGCVNRSEAMAAHQREER